MRDYKINLSKETTIILLSGFVSDESKRIRECARKVAFFADGALDDLVKESERLSALILLVNQIESAEEIDVKAEDEVIVDGDEI